MPRHLLLSFALIALLSACSGPSGPATDTVVEPPPTAIADAGTQAPAALAETSFGHYSVGDTRIEFRDAVWLPAEPGTVSVLLAPTVLSAAEREAVLSSTTFPGLPLFSKRVDAYADRYPFVVLKLRVEGEGEAVQVRSYYLMASSIHEPNYTDNLNGFPDAAHPLQLDAGEGAGRRLRFSGEEELGGTTRRWDFDVAG